jgi:hypothetical protein
LVLGVHGVVEGRLHDGVGVMEDADGDAVGVYAVHDALREGEEFGAGEGEIRW